MNVIKTEIPDVLIIEPKVYGDNRGFIFESYNERTFRGATGLAVTFVQDNHSRSARGVLRGLHFQVEQPQGKLVRCAVGEVFDVAVDIRRDSPTFGCWVGQVLSADNKRQMWIPEGFAHGFLVLSDFAETLYKTINYYSPQHERAIRWDDPDLTIDWPLKSAPLLSAKDSVAPTFAEYIVDQRCC